MANRGRYSKVSRRKWVDEKIRRMRPPPPCGFTLFDRFLTGPELTNVPGLFPAREVGLADALGWDLEAFREAFREVFREGLAKADWSAGLVWIPNSIFHNEPESPNVVCGWEKTLADMPDCELKREAIRALDSYIKAKAKASPKTKGKAWVEAWAKASGQIQIQIQKERESEPSLPAASSAADGARTESAPESTRIQIRSASPKVPDRFAQAMAGTGPGTREDVRRLHEAWKVGVGRTGATLRHDTGDDAQTLASAIDAHGLADCLLVAAHAANDGMVSGKLDDRGAEHKSIRYIFGNEDAFSRILAAAKAILTPTRKRTIEDYKSAGRL